mmetsp:Transcript_35637/g.83364  ORF Transcript_35637/g.83364 Transcript_35637/m.83364 type:complete len:230 (+) Transcript_35637:152-841(+)
MPYPTPGFVVRQTFLEFEPEEDAEPTLAPRFRHRAGSDSEICCQAARAKSSLYGSEEMRLYVEGEGETAEDPRSLELNLSQGSGMPAPRKVRAEECSTVLREHIRSEGLWPARVNESSQSGMSGVEEEPPAETSVGSRHHPEGCAAPCKYNTKSRGCKDGADCGFCHLCPWKPPKDKGRHQRRRAAAAARKLAEKQQAAEDAGEDAAEDTADSSARGENENENENELSA